MAVFSKYKWGFNYMECICACSLLNNEMNIKFKLLVLSHAKSTIVVAVWEVQYKMS